MLWILHVVGVRRAGGGRWAYAHLPPPPSPLCLIDGHLWSRSIYMLSLKCLYICIILLTGSWVRGGGGGGGGGTTPKPYSKPPLFKLSCACCQVEAEASTAVHSEKHRCTQSSNMAKASLTRGRGVFLDRCTSLQKLPHCLRGYLGVNGSHSFQLLK